MPQAEEAKKCLAQGGDIVYAAREGLWGAVRHFLKEDPMCVKKTDKNRREAWLVVGRDGLWRGLADRSRLVEHVEPFHAFSMARLQDARGVLSVFASCAAVGSRSLCVKAPCRGLRGTAPRPDRPAFSSDQRWRLPPQSWLHGGAAAEAWRGRWGEEH